MLKNKCFLYVIIFIRFFSITICNLLIEFPSYVYMGQRSTSATVCRPKRNKSGTAGSRRFLNAEISEWKTADRRNTCEQEATDNSPYVLRGVLFNGNINSGIPSYKTIQQSHITLKSSFDHILRLVLAILVYVKYIARCNAELLLALGSQVIAQTLCWILNTKSSGIIPHIMDVLK